MSKQLHKEGRNSKKEDGEVGDRVKCNTINRVERDVAEKNSRAKKGIGGGERTEKKGKKQKWGVKRSYMKETLTTLRPMNTKKEVGNRPVLKGITHKQQENSVRYLRTVSKFRRIVNRDALRGLGVTSSQAGVEEASGRDGKTVFARGTDPVKEWGTVTRRSRPTAQISLNRGRKDAGKNGKKESTYRT